jgi:gluconolactonase
MYRTGDVVAWTADGALVFSSGANRIYRLQPDVRAVTVFRAKSGGATGLAVSPDGLLTMCRPRAVVRMNPHGDEAVLAEGLNRPHDLVYASDGTLYFTDPPGGVLRWRDGELALVTDALAAPTAIALDGCRLYVADGGTVVRIDLASGARDTVHAGDEPVGGLTVDPDGRLFVCTPRGIHVHSELIELPESPRNAVWAGGDLYVTTTSSIYRIRRNR